MGQWQAVLCEVAYTLYGERGLGFGTSVWVSSFAILPVVGPEMLIWVVSGLDVDSACTFTWFSLGLPGVELGVGVGDVGGFRSSYLWKQLEMVKRMSCTTTGNIWYIILHEIRRERPCFLYFSLDRFLNSAGPRDNSLRGWNFGLTVNL